MEIDLSPSRSICGVKLCSHLTSASAFSRMECMQQAVVFIPNVCICIKVDMNLTCC